MLVLVALAGLIGNTGHISKEKLEIQNSADSIAYSSSLWMARGMNSVTASNHMLGEATAMTAVHEAIGGPELNLSIKNNTQENKALDRIIRVLSKTAPTIPSMYSPSPIPNIDRRVVDFVTKRTSPPDGRMGAFAMIYDSRMTLKRKLAITLTAKSIANLGFLVPPPWGFATAAAAYVVHIAGTVNIVSIGKEWFVLRALEEIAKSFKLMKSIVEKQLVPTLVEHSNFVAGLDATSNDPKPGILNNATKRLVLDLEQRLSVEAALFPEFKQLKLPVTPEPKPNMRGTTQSVDGWGEDIPAVVPMPELNADGMKRKLDNALNKMQKRSDQLNENLKELDEFESDIEERLKEDDVDASEKSELQREQQEIEQSRQAKEKRIAEINEKLDEVRTQRTELNQTANQLPSRSDNPSIKSIPKKMDQNQERYTQWVRATYPQTDAFRAPIRAWLKKWAPKSKAAEHFDKWTNRYTLVKAWQFRSGYRARKSGNVVVWDKRQQALRMLVMKGTFRGGYRDRKGYERWAGTSSTAKAEAEKLFTLIGIAHREYEPLFSTSLYPAPTDTGITAYAQAIFYNANPEQPASGREKFQQKIGWDTLNWDPDVDVPEWGAPAHRSSAKWPWEAFDGSVQNDVARVKLNWQAKLMPVRTPRLKEAAVTVSGDARKNVEHATQYFDQLGHH
ncbi:MAG: hypothetical protein AAGA30_00300 [Planctomycetota bacterium]